MSTAENKLRTSKAAPVKQLVRKNKSILETDNEFTAMDLPGKWYTGDKQLLIERLRSLGALEKLERRHFGGGNYFNVYQWNEEYRQELKTILNEQPKFSDYLVEGCDCKTHIKHGDDAFVCRYCGKTYTKEQIKQIEL